jgi:hypothetical protein
MRLLAGFQRTSVIMSYSVDDYLCLVAFSSLLIYFIIITINSLFFL